MQALDELSVADMCARGSAVECRQEQANAGPVGSHNGLRQALNVKKAMGSFGGSQVFCSEFRCCTRRFTEATKRAGSPFNSRTAALDELRALRGDLLATPWAHSWPCDVLRCFMSRPV